MGRISATLFFSFLLISSAYSFYLPGVAPRDFRRGDFLSVKVHKLSSTKTQLPDDYYYLKYCKPDKIVNSAETLGEVLRGDRIENSVYNFEMMEEQPCKVACRMILDAESAKNFKEKIDDEYRVNMILDNLPVAVLSQRRGASLSTTYKHGFRVGFKGNYAGSKEEKYFINNHLSFRVMYHKDPESGSARIVGFEVIANSINHEYKEWDYNNPQVTTCNKDTKKLIQGSTVPQEVDSGKAIVFTYDVTFKESDIKWASRWDTYLLMNDDQIHFFSIINSLMIVVFLSGMVAMIMMRTLFGESVQTEKRYLSHTHDKYVLISVVFDDDLWKSVWFRARLSHQKEMSLKELRNSHGDGILLQPIKTLDYTKESGTALTGSTVYIIGGRTDFNPVEVIYASDPDSPDSDEDEGFLAFADRWEKLIEEREASIDGSYFMHNKVEAFDAMTGDPIIIPNMNRERKSCAAVSFRGKIYAFGGIHPGPLAPAHQLDVRYWGEVYDPDTFGWKFISAPPSDLLTDDPLFAVPLEDRGCILLFNYSFFSFRCRYYPATDSWVGEYSLDDMIDEYSLDESSTMITTGEKGTTIDDWLLNESSLNFTREITKSSSFISYKDKHRKWGCLPEIRNCLVYNNVVYWYNCYCGDIYAYDPSNSQLLSAHILCDEEEIIPSTNQENFTSGLPILVHLDGPLFSLVCLEADKLYFTKFTVLKDKDTQGQDILKATYVSFQFSRIDGHAALIEAIAI
ncbi:hypothetical protein JCGZ_24783 [Jatropha curcas]|uniref:Transmembrane 9 superfamily member n=1 Tax=Jatropha curcas TaxID=180498 RepID=A0A067L9M6_JATCU|nr:hypothetical protein JCGZ_24783 [Jatropha curcas]